MTVTTGDMSPTRFFGPGQGSHDHDLRHAVCPDRGVTITDLVTGEEIRIETEDSVREVIVTPPGWELPAPDG